MKRKIILMLLVAIFLLSMPAGCSQDDQGEIEKIALNNGYINEEGLELIGAGIFSIPLEGSQGLLLLKLYNDSDQRVNAADPIILSLYDETDNLLATETINPTNILGEFRMLFAFPGKGTLVCEKPSGEIRIAMAYATPDSSNSLKDGISVPILSTDAGTAEYELILEENRLVQISGKTALIDEEGCTFSVYANDVPVASDLAIETTEWSSRQLYLEKGDYKIVFQKIDPNSICQSLVRFDEDFQPVVDAGNGQTQSMGSSNEFIMGFMDGQDQWLKVDKETPFQLYAISIGPNTYYDNETYFLLDVYSSDGSLIYSKPEDTATEEINLPASENGYFLRISLTNSTNGVIKIALNNL